MINMPLLKKNKNLNKEIQMIVKNLFKKKMNFNQIMTDSLSLIRLVVEIEKKYKIKIPINELNNKNLSSLKNLENLIKKLI
tara:strand:+ start:4356 stop:4598 length:243 start_codon:yes stop_codon:yes gene_type:complete